MIPKTDDFKEFGYNTAYFHSIFDSSSDNLFS